ncbi:MAG TPA: Holliday junction resolvase RuvX [Bacteroidota bacterium]|nr:Holliday junction resolvase RuvX [Bacteroidota bacterium]
MGSWKWSGSSAEARTRIVAEFHRVLGIDYGSRRIGISQSDPLGIIAQPRTTLNNDRGLWEELRAIVRTENVRLIVVGMPLNLKGQMAQKAEEVRGFIERLKEETGVEVVGWDERFTTSLARRTLIEMGTKKKDRRSNKQNIDAMAASLILQSFLDSTKNSLSC